LIGTLFDKLTIPLSIVLLTTLIAGCVPPMNAAIAGVELVKAQQDEQSVPTHTPTPVNIYQPPSDATVTPTPFQPLPPTPVYMPTATSTPTLIPSDTPVVLAPDSEQVISELSEVPNQITILLLGSDKRPWGSGFRTDTIILAVLNMELGTVNLMSFPRDLFVDIPGWGQDRINTAWGHGGFKSLAATMQRNFGVRPDHYVLLDFRSFKQIIDSLGGIDVDVEVPVSDYRGGRWVTIKKGLQHMNADVALWYVRTRKTTNDFHRNRRQQEVVRAIFEKMLTINGLLRIPEFYELYKNNVTTSLTWEDIRPWLPLAAKMTDSSALNHYYVGPNAAYDWITYSGAMVLIPQKDKINKIIQKALNLR
jgi:polyisoprenyl-teichoic acid--peptidoglycan teichoic acid transferase